MSWIPIDDKLPPIELNRLTDAITKKIDLVIGGINSRSSREADLLSAQAVQALSEAYKNLKETDHD